MPAALTRDNAIERAKQRAHMERSKFVTDAEWLTYLNSGIYHTYGLLARAGLIHDEKYEEIAADGSEYLSLAATDIFAIKDVFWVNGGRWWRLNRFEHREHLGPSHTGNAWKYRLTTTPGASTMRLWLQPIPSSGTYRVVYVPEPAPLLANPPFGYANTVILPMDWQELPILLAAKKALAKEMTSNPAVDEEITRLERRIQDEQEARELAETAVVQNSDKYRAPFRDPADWFWVRGA